MLVKLEVLISVVKYYADFAGLLCIETIEKTGEGVLEAFTEIAKHIPVDAKPKHHQAASSGNARTELVDLQRRTNVPGRDGCSC